MPRKQTAKKVMAKDTKMTAAEKKKLKILNKQKANPGKSAAKKIKQDAKRARRAERRPWRE